jgi:hypothetical protein
MYWFLVKLCKPTFPNYFKRFSNFTTMSFCEQAIQTVGPCLDFSISPRASKRSLFNKFEEHIGAKKTMNQEESRIQPVIQ